MRSKLRKSAWISSRPRPNQRPSVLSPKYEVFCCGQNGPPARRKEGAYLNRYATDEQRSRRSIFIATLWAGASWLFFLRRGGSTRMTQIWALRSRLEKSAASEPPAKYLVFRGQDTSVSSRKW